MNSSIRIYLLNFGVQVGEPIPPLPQNVVTEDVIDIITESNEFVITER
jgi:hypothetical protein